MHFSTILLGAAALSASTVLAAAPQGSKAMTVRFDTIPTGSPIPDDYQGVPASWSGFTVQRANNSGVFPASGANVAVSAGVFGAHIVNTNTSSVALQIRSLSFACASAIPCQGIGRLCVMPCGLRVLTNTYTAAIESAEVGPFNYTTPNGESISPLTKLNFNGTVFGAEIWFMLTDTQAFSQLVIDNVVFEPFDLNDHL